MIKPYYDHDGITIYNCDVRDLLSQLQLTRFDLTYADPPYGHGDKWQGGGWASDPMYREAEHGWDAEPVPLDLLVSCIARSDRAIVWGGNYYALSPQRCWLSWIKNPAMGTMADFELAWTNLDRPSKCMTETRNPDGKRQHPTQKPVSITRWALGQCPWETLFSPFMGSGPELQVAKELRRRAVACDVSERYCEVAAKRLRQEMLFSA